MRALGSLAKSALPTVAALGLCALAASAWLGGAVSTADADVMDPTVEKTIAIGTGGATWATDRGSAQRNGRVESLPTLPNRKWKRNIGAAINFAPVVARDGAVILLVPATGAAASESTLLELSPTDGKTRQSTRIGDVAAAGPVLLASGLRVVVSVRDAIGIDAAGVIRFRTALGGSVATTGRAVIVPLPTGGFSIARAGELLELDSAGTIAGRVKLDITAPIAARDNGETVAVAPNGDLFTWRAGKVPRLVGTFGDKALQAAGIANVCPFGPVLDGASGSATAGKRRERALCVLGNEVLVEQLDLATGKRSAVLATPVPLLHFRTTVAVGAGGDVALGSSDGTVSGLGPTGLEYGPIDVPGAVSLLGLGKDAGIFGTASQGEFAPLVAEDGAVLFGSTDGVAIAYPTGLVSRISKCAGASGAALATVAGVASAGPHAVLLACSNGDVELIGEGVAPPAPPPPSNTALEPMPIPSGSASAP